MLSLIDATSPDLLVYDQGGEVIVFDQTQSATPRVRTLIVRNHTRLRWYSVATGDSQYHLTIITESGESIIRTLLLARETQHNQMTLHSTLNASDTVTNIHILSLVGESGTITLNGTVQIDAGIARVRGHILEENIFLGSRGSIRGIPSLLVHSDDVEAGHAARIERVSDDKLYYLRSRGIPADDATVMMIRSALATLLEGLDDEYQSAILTQVIATVLTKNLA